MPLLRKIGGLIWSLEFWMEPWMIDPIAESPEVETDPRFPSGPWTGFFLQQEVPGRHWMELRLTFKRGMIQGEGRDRVGEFLIKGRYQIEDGKCHWSKTYIGRHSVFYKGFNEGKGIWGTWEIPPVWRGGFHIWPEGMADPTKPALTESVKRPESVPVIDSVDTQVEEPVGVP